MWQGLCAEWPRDQEPGSAMHHGGCAALLWQHSQWQTATPILGCTWLSFLLYSGVYAMVSNCMSAGYQQNKNLIKCIKSCQVNTQLSVTPQTSPSVELWRAFAKVPSGYHCQPLLPSKSKYFLQTMEHFNVFSYTVPMESWRQRLLPPYTIIIQQKREMEQSPTRM